MVVVVGGGLVGISARVASEHPPPPVLSLLFRVIPGWPSPGRDESAKASEDCGLTGSETPPGGERRRQEFGNDEDEIPGIPPLCQGELLRGSPPWFRESAAVVPGAAPPLGSNRKGCWFDL